MVSSGMQALTTAIYAIRDKSVIVTTERESNPDQIFNRIESIQIIPFKVIGAPYLEDSYNPRKDKRKQFTPQPWRDKRK